jgi:hypothetical protein
MKITLSDKIIAWLALLSGLTISAVAIWYSVAGLVSIFAAAVIPIIVMGVVLEISKLIATVWLKLNWNRAPVFIRTYLLVAIAILMLITSMGIFGFLSKAHSDQSLVSGDVQAKIAVYDEKIKTEKENIEANRKALRQMDEAVDQSMARSTTEQGASRAVSIRQQQTKERTRLQNEITTSQKKINGLNEERAPIAAEVRKVEAEVGPIKYIANFIYGDNPEANTLEKAVTWVIIIIVAVFDPLAVILLLASQYSFQWFRKAREEEEQPKSINDFVPQPQTLVVDDEQDVKDFFTRGKLVARGLDADEDARLAKEANDLIAEIEKPEPEIDLPPQPEPEKSILEQHPYLNQPFAHFENLTPIVHKPELEEVHEDTKIIESAEHTEKEAMKAWKRDNPEGSLKLQRNLLEKGIIGQLPWEIYLKAAPDLTDKEAAEEAAKWAIEQLERPVDESESKKKVTSWIERDGVQQIKKSIDDLETGYVQNAEQGDSTIWQRVKKAKGE